GFNEWATGDKVIYDNNADDKDAASNIGGLASGAYYVIKVGRGVIKLGTSNANALAGTFIDLTSQGSGSDHALTKSVVPQATSVNLGAKHLHALDNATLTATADNFTGGFGLLAGAADSKSTAITRGATLAYVGE